MTLVDSHAHLTSDDLYPEIDQLLARAKSVGVETVVNICTNKSTLERGIQVRKGYPNFYNVASTTPHDVHIEGEEVFPLIEKVAREKQIVAVGETGLDYYYWKETREIQIHYFKKYLALARECDLPIVIHCRDAFEDLFEVLEAHYSEGGRWLPGVLHCFTGTVEEAKVLIEKGWNISFSGIVTYKKSEELREVARLVPLEQMFIETDSPYLAPQPVRGKRNEPSYLPDTAKVLAELRGLSFDDFAAITSQNAKKFFGIGA